MIDPKEVEKVVDAMVEELGEDKFNEIRHQAYIYRIICSMYYTDSIDPDVLTKHISNGFENQVPIEHIADIVNGHLPNILKDEGFYCDGQLTDDAVLIAISHNRMLHLDYVKVKHPPVKHLH